jgi:hypothetical protein
MTQVNLGRDSGVYVLPLIAALVFVGGFMGRHRARSHLVHAVLGGSRLRRRLLASAAAVALAATGAVAAVAMPSAAVAAGTVTYTNTQTFPVPPASSYAGSGGGDGWGLAFSATQVFNVFHHDSSLTVACHEQADASPCYSPETITDPASGAGFTVGGHAGLWMDAGTGKLYVFVTRTDATAGVVCIDTTQAATNTNPFCGFTPLTAVGAADLSPGYSSLSDTMQVGPRLYAFNYADNHAAPDGDFNTLLCFDTTTHAACAGQPYRVDLGSGNLSSYTAPGPGVAAIGGKVIVTGQLGGVAAAGCFDPATGGTCAGSWPITSLPVSYPGSNGAPFPRLSATGALSGFCLPTGTDECWDMSGAAVPTPAGMSGVIGGTSPYNGQAVVLGPRVYVPNGTNDEVDCFDSATGASCTQFPHSVAALGGGYMYTVTADPARPTCIWVNSDDGSGQIQNFDAYTGGACGQGPIRVLASSFVVDTQLCQPASYTSLQITSPARNTYTSGTVDFEDADANQIPGLPTVSLDSTGSASLSGLNLTTAYSLPQFLITLTGASSTPASVTATLTWTGTDDPSCVKPGTTTTGSTQLKCGNVMMMTAIGSGEHFNGEQRLDNSVSPVLTALLNSINTKLNGVRTVEPYVIDYPADPVTELVDGLVPPSGHNPVTYLNTLASDAGTFQANATDYLAGKDVGVTEMTHAIQAVRKACPDAKLLLVGYSQGAMVVHDWLNYYGPGIAQQPIGKLIIGVGLIADPERTKNSQVLNFSDAIPSGYGVCDIAQKFDPCPYSGQPLADITSAYLPVTASLCKADDIVCDTSKFVHDYAVDTKAGRQELADYTQWVHTQYYQRSPEIKTLGSWLGLRVLKHA